MPKIDLHIHTDVSSDGEYSPEKIVEKCREQGIRLAAVCDHNSVRGVSAALSAEGAQTGEVKVVSGVEFDCAYGGKNFHLLGYGFDHTRGEFAQVERDIVKQEQNAAEEKIRLFTEASGIPVNAAQVMAASGNGVVTGELIAELVLARRDAGEYGLLRPYLPGGEKSDMPNVRFYWDFFAEGRPAYVPIRYLSLPDAAELVHAAGGIAVLAHPGQNLSLGDGLLSRILSEDIDGIEAFSSYHTREEAAFYLERAERNSLLATCGSDFHGRHKPQIGLGGHGADWSGHERMEERLLQRLL